MLTNEQINGLYTLKGAIIGDMVNSNRLGDTEYLIQKRAILHILDGLINAVNQLQNPGALREGF